jgi:hypothetical protein
MSDAELSTLWPVIRTSEYLRMAKFVADALPTPELAVVWVLVAPGSVLYVTTDQVRAWESRGVAWRAAGIMNLREATRSSIFTQETRREDGSPLWFGMLHDDGLGSSRALLGDALSYYLGDDYLVAVPERSCGIAMPGNLTDAERESVMKTVVQPCFRNGTAPLSPTLFRSDQLKMPASWLA